MRLRCTTLLLAVALLALAVVPSCASAAGRVLAERALSPAVADADAIAYLAQPGEVRLLDARGDERATLPIGGACLEPPTSIGPLGGGQLVFSCRLEQTAPYPYVIDGEVRMLDLATHEEHVPAGAAAALQAAIDEPVGSGSFDAVGTHGLLFRSSSYHGGVTVEGIDWRTGAHVREPGADAVLDMDSPSLVTPLCAPLSRQPWDVPPSSPVDPPPAFDPLVYAPPYALTAGPRSRLLLRRCGTTNERVVEPDLGRRQVIDMQLAPGFATWRLGVLGRYPTRLRGYLLACHVLLDWELGIRTRAVPTREALVLSDAADDDGPWRVRSIPLDGICERARAAGLLTARNGARSVGLSARRATLGLPDRDATATLPSRFLRLRHLAVRAGTSVRLLPGGPARAVRWRAEAGGWHRLPAGPGGWRLPATATGDLAIDVRYRQGGSARFDVHLAPLR